MSPAVCARVWECECVHVCVSVWSVHTGQWPLGHRGQRSSTPTEEVRKCLAWGSDKDSHPSFLSLAGSQHHTTSCLDQQTLRCIRWKRENRMTCGIITTPPLQTTPLYKDTHWSAGRKQEVKTGNGTHMVWHAVSLTSQEWQIKTEKRRRVGRDELLVQIILFRCKEREKERETRKWKQG